MQRLPVEFFWYPDLAREALAQGWAPRGKQRSEVAWRRNDSAPSRTMVAPPEKPRN